MTHIVTELFSQTHSWRNIITTTTRYDNWINSLFNYKFNIDFGFGKKKY